MNAPVAQAEPATPFAAQARLRAVVVRLEGEFNHAGVYQAMQGDAIVVPEDWTQIFYQFGLGAAAIQVIRN